ncbi:hypothetical protein N9L19_01015, partial [bacterium]|nr:hypothetical protein [bacterium]
ISVAKNHEDLEAWRVSCSSFLISQMMDKPGARNTFNYAYSASISATSNNASWMKVTMILQSVRSDPMEGGSCKPTRMATMQKMLYYICKGQGVL